MKRVELHQLIFISHPSLLHNRDFIASLRIINYHRHRMNLNRILIIFNYFLLSNYIISLSQTKARCFSSIFGYLSDLPLMPYMRSSSHFLSQHPKHDFPLSNALAIIPVHRHAEERNIIKSQVYPMPSWSKKRKKKSNFHIFRILKKYKQNTKAFLLKYI